MPLSDLLAKDRVYKVCPQMNAIVIDKFLNNLSRDWLARLAQVIYENVSDRTFEQIHLDLGRHDRQMNTASAQGAKQLLQFFYLLMSKACVIPELDFSEQMIADFAIKIDEGLPNCNPGFQNRLFELQKALIQPKNFTERLARYRESLVEKTATNLTNDVHGHNFVFRAAQSYGVNAINAGDSLSIGVDQAEIPTALAATFDALFTPMHIIDHLESQLLHELTVHDYEGRLDSAGQGYVEGRYAPMMAHLNAIFAVNESYDFWFVLDEETSIIFDINWRQIRLSIIEKLYNEGLFTKKQLAEDDIKDALTDFILYLKNASAEEFELHSGSLAGRITNMQDLKPALRCVDSLDRSSSVHYSALNAALNTISLGFISSAADYAALSEPANSMRKAMLSESVADYFMGYIDTRSDFIAIFKTLNGKQAAVLCQALGNELPRLFKTRADLLSALATLNTKQAEVLCQALGNELPRLFKTPADLFSALATLKKKQAEVLYQALGNELPRLFNTKADVLTALATLKTKQAEVLCQALGNELPRLFNTTADVLSALETLRTKRAEVLWKSLIYHLPTIIRTGDDCIQMLTQLDSDKHPALIKALEHHLPTLMNRMYRPLRLLRYVTTEQTRALFANSKELPVIKSIYDITESMRLLQPEQYALLFEQDKQGFNQAIWHASSFTASELPPHSVAEIYQLVDEHSSTLRQLAFHVGRYSTDFVKADSIDYSPLYLINSHKFFVPYRNIGDMGNKLIKPAAMVLMHCFSCVAHLKRLAWLLAATAVSLLLLPITLTLTLWSNHSYFDSYGNLGFTLPLILRSLAHLASINAQILVMLPLAIASVFTRSATTVFSVFSNCWNNSDLLEQDSEALTVDEAPGFMV